MLYWLVGMAIEGVTKEAMVAIWRTTGYSMAKMYKEVIKAREGVD